MNRNFFTTFFYKWVPRVLSSLFHPLIMPTLGVFIILNSGTYLSLLEYRQKMMILLMIFVSTFALPVAFIPFFYYRKIVKSIEMGDNRERFLPLLVTGALYYVAYLILHFKGMPLLIQAFVMASAVTVFVNLLVNIRWKISSHMMGIGGIIGLIITIIVLFKADMIVFLMLAILLTGLIAYSRLSLNSHTPAQVYTGLAAGILIVMVVLRLF